MDYRAIKIAGMVGLKTLQMVLPLNASSLGCGKLEILDVYDLADSDAQDSICSSEHSV